VTAAVCAVVCFLALCSVAVECARLRKALRQTERKLADLETERAEQAARLLARSASCVAGVELPDIADLRWVPESQTFETGGIQANEIVLKLGDIFVKMVNGLVYVGPGPALPDSTTYGKAVVTSYRNRVAAKAKT
jgi:hypothetical protein